MKTPKIVITPTSEDLSPVTEIYIKKKKSDNQKLREALFDVKNRIREARSRNNGRGTNTTDVLSRTVSP